MHNLYKYAMECMSELGAIGIPYRTSFFEVNHRAVYRWGLCRSNGDGTFTIQISSVLLDDNNSIEGLKNTIIHELIHTCVDCMNHGKKWKEYADRVNKHYGYDIKRTSNSEEKGVSVNTIKENKRHYEVTCSSCGKKFIYYRDCKVTKNPSRFHCSCGGRLSSVLVEKDGTRYVTLSAVGRVYNGN